MMHIIKEGLWCAGRSKSEPGGSEYFNIFLLVIPDRDLPRPNRWVKESKAYVEKNFPENPGHTNDFFYPVTHGEAEAWLDDFLRDCLLSLCPKDEPLFRGRLV